MAQDLSNPQYHTVNYFEQKGGVITVGPLWAFVALKNADGTVNLAVLQKDGSWQAMQNIPLYKPEAPPSGKAFWCEFRETAPPPQPPILPPPGLALAKE